MPSFNDTTTRYFCIKLLHRIAQLGQPVHGARLAAMVSGETDAALASLSAQVIDHLLPEGSKTIEDQLALHFVTADGHSLSRAYSSTAPLESTLYRLRIRSAAPTPAP